MLDQSTASSSGDSAVVVNAGSAAVALSMVSELVGELVGVAAVAAMGAAGAATGACGTVAGAGFAACVSAVRFASVLGLMSKMEVISDGPYMAMKSCNGPAPSLSSDEKASFSTYFRVRMIHSGRSVKRSHRS